MLSDGERMLGGLLRASHTATLEDTVPLIAGHAALSGFTHTKVYVSDLRQLMLVPLPGQVDARGVPLAPVSIDTTMPGRAFRDVEVVRAKAEEEPAAVQLWVPLIDGTERIGVLGATVQAVDETVEWRARQLASLVALILVSKRGSSDSWAALVRGEPMLLSAEVLWNLLPHGSFANDRVVFSAALEPAYQVGGDAYDYGIAGDNLHVSIFDAMGHDLSATLTATMAIGACRNSRLAGKDLLATSEGIDAAIGEQFGRTRFATGILADLDMDTGELTWINRGHHPPLVVRDGRLVASLDSELPSPPMGFGLGLSSGLDRYQLQRGDRLLLYTDGIIEAQNPAGEEFGLERFVDFIVRHEAGGLSAPETLRRLINSILDHQRGRLQDDATVVTVEWQAARQATLTI
ncbi:PP2C family protein-serine/threonine phosphatase [Nonomuraea sp. NPDC049725]|uniref:PP2C family protein-serine/threonine phosphatase n=1 Tax=Nonomuraea sp. NPDC049725 TaxID=3154508 RepID=UPI00342DAAC7